MPISSSNRNFSPASTTTEGDRFQPSFTEAAPQKQEQQNRETSASTSHQGLLHFVSLPLAIARLQSEPYEEILAALILLTGRTASQLVKSGIFSIAGEHQLEFTTQLKHPKQNRDLIPTPLAAEAVTTAIARLRNHPEVQPLRFLSPKEIDARCHAPLLHVLERDFDITSLDNIDTVHQQLLNQPPSLPEKPPSVNQSSPPYSSSTALGRAYEKIATIVERIQVYNRQQNSSDKRYAIVLPLLTNTFLLGQHAVHLYLQHNAEAIAYHHESMGITTPSTHNQTNHLAVDPALLAVAGEPQYLPPAATSAQPPSTSPASAIHLSQGGQETLEKLQSVLPFTTPTETAEYALVLTDWMSQLVSVLEEPTSATIQSIIDNFSTLPPAHSSWQKNADQCSTLSSPPTELASSLLHWLRSMHKKTLSAQRSLSSDELWSQLKSFEQEFAANPSRTVALEERQRLEAVVTSVIEAAIAFNHSRSSRQEKLAISPSLAESLLKQLQEPAPRSQDSSAQETLTPVASELDDLVARTVQEIMSFNRSQPNAKNRFAITQRLLRQLPLSRGNRTIQQTLEALSTEIQKHHEQYQIRTNRGKDIQSLIPHLSLPRQQLEADSKTRVAQIIDSIIEFNEQQDDTTGKWLINLSLLTQLPNTAQQDTIRAVLAEQKHKLDAHHYKHRLTKYHNRGKDVKSLGTELFDDSP